MVNEVVLFLITTVMSRVEKKAGSCYKIFFGNFI